MEKRTIGSNVEATIDGDTLTLVIVLSRDLGPSSTGKTRMIATTSGNVKLPGGERIGLNVYRSASGAVDAATITAGVEARRPS